MKVLQINSFVNVKSTGVIAEEIGLEILAEGWESIIVYGRGFKNSKSKLYKIGNKFDLLIHGFISFLYGKHGFGSKNSTKNLLKFINKERPDIVHLHNIHGYYINYSILFEGLKKINAKIVWTLHDCWAFTGHCTYFSDINCVKWQNQCYSCPKSKNYPKSLIFDNSVLLYIFKRKIFTSMPITIITVSEWLRNLVQLSFLKSNNINVISNGVDSNIFRPLAKCEKLLNKYNLNNKLIYLAVSTSWAKQKGFDDYLKLSKQLTQDEIIVLIGLPNSLRTNLPSNIIPIDKTYNLETLVKWYNIADIVLNLSTQESFGLTSVEGFMCGKPSIVYNTTASPELIKNRVMGRVVNTNNINEVYESIRNILNERIDHIQIREIAIHHYDARIQYKKYISLYKSVLDK